MSIISKNCMILLEVELHTMAQTYYKRKYTRVSFYADFFSMRIRIYATLNEIFLDYL